LSQFLGDGLVYAAPLGRDHGDAYLRSAGIVEKYEG
jgi:hypothetical protein